MTTVDANNVRIPVEAREALAKHEEVVVLHHGQPAYVIVNREDWTRANPKTPGRGRRLDEALEILTSAPLPDPAFGEDMTTIRELAGETPLDPWEPS
jgi:hypothetical protein